MGVLLRAVVVVGLVATVTWPERQQSIALRFPDIQCESRWCPDRDGGPLRDDACHRSHWTGPHWAVLRVESGERDWFPEGGDARSLASRLRLPVQRMYTVPGNARPGPPHGDDFCDREYLVWRRSWLTATWDPFIAHPVTSR